ncbi:MAG: TRL-like family protein [bacterium]
MFHKSHLYLSILIIASLLLTGCASTMTPALETLYNNVNVPHAAPRNSGYSKVGSAKSASILGMIAVGDASIETAMKNGDISTIHYVDYHGKNILGLYAELTVIVYGE